MGIQGFGVTARSTAEARRLDPTGIVCFRQADVGEYLREVSPQGSLDLGSAADCSIGGYSFHNDVASCWDSSMQHERNRIISGQPLRQKICRGVILSVEDLASHARIERARSHPNPAIQSFDLIHRR